MINAQNLSAIKNTHQFFNTDKVLFIDLISLDDSHNPCAAELLRNSPNTFSYNGKTYYLLMLKGSPENLILNAKKGVPFPSLQGAFMQWQLNLRTAIQERKVFDLSKYQYTETYKNGSFHFEHDFLIKQFAKELVHDESSTN